MEDRTQEGEAGVHGAQVASAIAATYKGMSPASSCRKDNGNQVSQGQRRDLKDARGGGYSRLSCELMVFSTDEEIDRDI